MTDLSLAGRVALVTGGSGGIGAALCARLAAEGAAVAVGYGTGRDAAQRVVEACTAARARAVALEADMASPDAPAELVAATEEALGPVDVLVANAGVGERRMLDEVTPDDWETAIDVNLRAPFLLAQRVVPGMRERGFGRVLLVSSVAAFVGGMVGPHYAASKAGLHGLVHYIASRYAAYGVTANGIAPALIERTAMLPGDPSDLAERIPVRRLGRPEEVADLGVALLRNGYVTDQVVSVDGGMYPH
jgi:3-oxoacyl-[acyl-carrier protein] reductase